VLGVKVDDLATTALAPQRGKFFLVVYCSAVAAAAFKLWPPAKLADFVNRGFVICSHFESSHPLLPNKSI
jgi:hypothetical protein